MKSTKVTNSPFLTEAIKYPDHEHCFSLYLKKVCDEENSKELND